MEIILKEDIKGLGYKNDIIKVKDGYGRNYLIPQKLALLATDSNKKIVAENIKQAAHKAEKIKTEATSLSASLEGLVISISTKVGDSGKIFGAITSLQVSDALKAKGFSVDRKKISFKEDIKTVGDYTAVLDLHKEVKQSITVSVVSE
ncbi:MAG: 50S ribosomal protein L9 [Cytophagales bacterium]